MKDVILFETTPRLNAKWVHYNTEGKITLRPENLFGANERVFTMGSCFVERIKYALTELGITCVPEYLKVPVDPNRMWMEGSGEPHFHTMHFNSFTILQELQKAVGEWEQEPDDFWPIKRDIWPSIEGVPPGPVYQCPYRRLCIGRTLDDAIELSGSIDKVIRDGFNSATVFVFTFGVTEVFRQKSNGRVVGQKPLYFGGGGMDETVMEQSTFADNYANMEKIIQIIRTHRPDAKIVMTVSPIPLERTFSDADVVVASTTGKATLRAAVAEIVRAYPDVLYFPSYEIVAQQAPYVAFVKDGRHVRPELVDMITQTFVWNYFDLPDKKPPTAIPQQDL